MTQKNPYIDYLKGLAILLVLIGHCIQYGSGEIFLNSGVYWENTVMKVIYSFHMPLFMAGSGYLFWYSVKRHGMINGIKSRVNRLVPVCFCWALILSTADLMNGEFSGIKNGIYYFLTDFWFLWAIVFATFCVGTIELCNKIFRGVAHWLGLYLQLSPSLLRQTSCGHTLINL